MEIRESTDYKGHTITIYADEDAESPGEWENEEMFLVAFDSRNCWIERKGVTQETVASIFNGGRYEDYSVNEHACELLKQYHVLLLEAYIHSGVVLALAKEGNFVDRQWDVSTLGAVFVQRALAKRKDKARRLARGLVETWNTYLSGGVEGYTVDDVDSCWGFYDRESLIESARGAIDYAVEQARKKKQHRTKALIQNHVPIIYRSPCSK